MNWLEQVVPNKEPPKKTRKKREVDPCKRNVPTAVLDRLLEKSKVYEEQWTKNRLYASGVCCDTYFDMTKELIRFWCIPAEEKVDYIGEARKESGNTKHRVLQKHAHSTGILHEICTTDDEFKEPYCIFPEHAISGKIDLIMPDPKYIKDLDKGKEGKIEYYQCVDIKETESQYYKGVSQKLWQSYRGQLSLYIKWFHEEHGGHEKKGSFWYQNRDTPKKHKMFEYEKEDHLIDLAFSRGAEFINHVSNRTFPNNEFSQEWVSEQIDKWKELETQYLKYELIESGEKKLRKWPEYSGVNYKIN